MHSSSPFRPGRRVPDHALALTLLCGCTGGDDLPGSSFGSSISASQVSQASADTGVTTSGANTSGEPTTTGESATTGAAGTTTDDPSAATTTGVDPSTTGDPTSDPSTTTGVDPSTTTGVDPSTTTGVDPSTTTGDPPDPPAKDPQPANGLYETCIDNTPCEPALTDGCFTITDAMTMKVIDGYCTILCVNVGDCGPAPNAPAVQECFAIAPDQKVCGLKCKGVADCPGGMACTNLSLPNNQTGMYCT